MAAGDLGDLFRRFGDWLAAQPGLAGAPRLASASAKSDRAIALARASDTTPRHHRRSFAGSAGLGPKRWLLLHRVDAVLRDARLADPAYPLAALAAEHGFADQAHLTRELKRFTGATPGAFRGRGRHYPPHMLLQR